MKRTSKLKPLPQRQPRLIPDEEPSPSPSQANPGPSQGGDNTYLLQMVNIIGQVKPLWSAYGDRLAGRAEELVRLHDLWEKEENKKGNEVEGERQNAKENTSPSEGQATS